MHAYNLGHSSTAVTQHGLLSKASVFGPCSEALLPVSQHQWHSITEVGITSKSVLLSGFVRWFEWRGCQVLNT
jgi:hypothetical protein